MISTYTYSYILLSVLSLGTQYGSDVNSECIKIGQYENVEAICLCKGTPENGLGVVFVTYY